MYVRVDGYWVRLERSLRRARPRFTGAALAVAGMVGFVAGVALARLA